MTPREEFEALFGAITDEQWQWLKEFFQKYENTKNPPRQVIFDIYPGDQLISIQQEAFDLGPGMSRWLLKVEGRENYGALPTSTEGSKRAE
jgi:hypothetical protein